MSLHDVMPDTMGDVADLIELCRREGVDRLALLVVPGLDWQPDQLDQIRQWQNDGHLLAAHGWQHRCGAIRSWWHRAHSLLLSRNAAEHLSLDAEEVSQLMDRSGNWFVANGFDVPELYVPPAWALGRISPDELRARPFKMVETLSGVIFPHRQTRRRLPVVGFEADTLLRALSLRVFNRAAVALAFDAPVRVSLHPSDHRLRLNSELVGTLGKCTEAMSYAALFSDPQPAGAAQETPNPHSYQPN